MFKILSESAISAGVRRIEAITGEKCEEFYNNLCDTILDIQSFLGNPSVVPAIKKMIETNESLNKQISEYKQAKINDIIEQLSKKIDPNAEEVVIAQQINLSTDLIKDIAYGLRTKFRNIILVIGSQNDDKASLTIMLGDDIVARGANASKTIREAARLIEGGGGGQPFFATAGGKNPKGIEEAIIKARDLILESIGK
jgi:alanyl-tRNA synthetase